MNCLGTFGSPFRTKLDSLTRSAVCHVVEKGALRAGTRTFCPPLQLATNVTRATAGNRDVHVVVATLVLDRGRVGGGVGCGNRFATLAPIVMHGGR